MIVETILSNSRSASKLAVTVFRMIRQLDSFWENDVDVFIPRFHKYEKFSHDSAWEVKAFTDELLHKNQKMYEDYHGREPVYHTFCESTGDIV